MFGLSPSASLIWAKSSTPLVMASSSALALVKNTAAALACSGQLPPAMSAMADQRFPNVCGPIYDTIRQIRAPPILPSCSTHHSASSEAIGLASPK